MHTDPLYYHDLLDLGDRWFLLLSYLLQFPHARTCTDHKMEGDSDDKLAQDDEGHLAQVGKVETRQTQRVLMNMDSIDASPVGGIGGTRNEQFIAEKTIEYNLTCVFEQWDVNDDSALTAWEIQLGLYNLPAPNKHVIPSAKIDEVLRTMKHTGKDRHSVSVDEFPAFIKKVREERAGESGLNVPACGVWCGV